MRWLSFLASGVPVILVFPAPSLSYLAWFALVPGMVLFTRAATTREAVTRGWWFGAGYLIAMLYWMAPEIGPGLVLLGAVMGGCGRRSPSPCTSSCGRAPRGGGRSPRSSVVPSCWLIPEWIRSYQGLGGPWDLYGASQWQHPAVLALAAVGGVWLVSVALLMANVALVVMLGALRAAWFRAAAGALAALGIPEGKWAPRRSPPLGAARPRRPPRSSPSSPRPGRARWRSPLARRFPPAARSGRVTPVQPGVVNDATQRTDASETLTAAAEQGRHARP